MVLSTKEKEIKMSNEKILSVTKAEIEILEDALISLVDSGYADAKDRVIMKLVLQLHEKLEDVWCSYEDNT